MRGDRIEKLEERGFDRCEANEEYDSIQVGCSQCDAVVINGVACHEHGCPNKPKEVCDAGW